MIRVAIIGLGAVTHNIHLPAYSRLKNRVSIVAGCDTNPEARKRARENWKLPEVFDDPQKMLEATAPDVVAVCTPPFLHRDQTLLALERGCHVFCEKPMADTLAQADEMIQAADAARRLVVINTQFPYMNIHTGAKKVIGSSEFGRLLFLQAWQSFRPTDHTEAGWRGELERRLCFEFGIHVFELIRYFFDDTPSRILAHMPHSALGVKSDSINIISVEFADGRAATIVLNRISKGPERYLDLKLDGEHASVHTSIGGHVQVSAGVHTREKKPFLRLGFAQGGRATLQDGNREKVIAKDGINPFASATARHFENFLDAVRDGGNPPGNVRDNRNTLAMVFAAYDSAQTGRVVEFADYLESREDRAVAFA